MRSFVLGLLWIAVLSSGIYAQKISIEHSIMRNYDTPHLKIYSDLHAGYMSFVTNVAETFSKNIEPKSIEPKNVDTKSPDVNEYDTGSKQLLTIYYCDTETKAEELRNERGQKSDTYNQFYIRSLPAIYAYRISKDGNDMGWQPLLAGMAHHYCIQKKLSHMPIWFQKETEYFLSSQARFIKDNLYFTKPGAQSQYLLKSKNLPINIKPLYLEDSTAYYNTEAGAAVARTIFNWLYDTNQVFSYIRNVQKRPLTDGRKFTALSTTVGKQFGPIETEIAAFVDKSAQQYLSEKTLKTDEKKKFFLKILELKPQDTLARLNLAKFYLEDKNYQVCRDHLEQILINPQNAEYYQALEMMANAYYKEKDYPKALEYFTKTWEISDCDEYRYKQVYLMANCNFHAGNKEKAKELYGQFLKDKWNSEDMKDCVTFAKKYINEAAQ